MFGKWFVKAVEIDFNPINPSVMNLELLASDIK
jgi:hypothetical protein